MTSDLACENEESLLAVKVIDRTRNHLEKEVVQECMNISVHASNQRVFLATKTLLGSFVHYRKSFTSPFSSARCRWRMRMFVATR